MNKILLSKLKNYNIELAKSKENKIYPYLIGLFGHRKTGFIVSSFHGRSVIIDQTQDNQYIILKGCGLTYTDNIFIDCNEYVDYGHLWGYLDLESATRDYEIGTFCKSLGISTAEYQFVLKLDYKFETLNSEVIYPYLLQYKIKCPFRLYDLPLICKSLAFKHLDKIKLTGLTYYESFARCLFEQLSILHNNNVFYNGMNTMNISAQGELLDWESSRTNEFPYDNKFDQDCQNIFPREVLNIFNICYFISLYCEEKYDASKVNILKKEFYISRLNNNLLIKFSNILKNIA